MIENPILLEPRIVPRVWGGQRLATEFGRQLESGSIGESWEVHGDLRVQGSDVTLDQLVERYGERLLGIGSDPGRGFPLLTKWLDCKAWLSVQVHPDDALAQEFTGQVDARGKTEAWYVHRADSSAELIHGLADGVEVTQLREAEGKRILPLLSRCRPREGQILYTPAGTVHALGPGNLIYEVQQSCDLTYRFYDWDRDREIHFQKAVACVERVQPKVAEQRDGLLRCRYFGMERLSTSTEIEVTDQSFEILATTGSPVELRWAKGCLHLSAGRSVVLPASLGELKIDGEFQDPLIRVGIPE